MSRSRKSGAGLPNYPMCCALFLTSQKIGFILGNGNYIIYTNTFGNNE